MVFFLPRLSPYLAIASVAAGLGFSSVFPALAGASWNEFDVCTTQLTASGVPANQAGTACSDALIPKELSECVTMIKAKTAITGVEALQGCYQVRRPVDLGNCVVDIVAATPIAAAAPTPAPTGEETASAAPETANAANPQSKILDSCRASLLPGRYSQCVIALSRDVSGLSPDGALETCLSAEAFPQDIFPAYAQ